MIGNQQVTGQTYKLQFLNAPTQVENAVILNLDLVVAPNPAIDYFILKHNGISTGLVRLYDLMGRLVKERSMSHTGTRIITKELPPGVYIARIYAKGRQYIRKVVVGRR